MSSQNIEVKMAVIWGVVVFMTVCCMGVVIFLIITVFERGFVIVGPGFLAVSPFGQATPWPPQDHSAVLRAEEAAIPFKVEVDSRQGWQATDLWADKNQKLTVEVIAGKWNYWPEGSPDNAGQGGNYICANTIPAAQCVEPLPDFPAGALIGRIGGQIFGIGSGATVVIQQTGRLYLRINDADHGLYDNQGKLIVKITAQAVD